MENQFVTNRTSQSSVLLCLLFIFFVPILGAVLLHDTIFLNVATYISLIALGAIILINVVITLVSGNKLLDSRKMRSELIDKQQGMHKDYPRYKRRLEVIAALSVCYLVMLVVLIMLINTAVFAFYGRVFNSAPVLNPFIAVGLSLILFSYELAVFIVASKTLDAGSHGELLPEAQYPEIFALARETAGIMGIGNPFMLKATTGRNAAICREGGSLTILLGVDLLNILNRNELRTVLMHEFAHAKSDTQTNHIITYRCNKWQYLSGQSNFFPSFMFRGFSAFINKHLALFQILSSYRCEVAADKCIFIESDRQHIVNAFAKLEMGAIYDFSLSEDCIYAAEEMPKQFAEFNRARFIAAYEKNKELWKKLALNQIQPLVNSHPSLPDRMKNLNIESFSIDFSCEDEKFYGDIKRITEKFDEFIGAETNWELLRRSNYLCYQKIIDDFNSKADNQDLYVVAYAYFYLCDYEKAEEILNIILKGENAKTALFLLGLLKCNRFDDGGVRDLFNSADSINNTERALQYVSNYLQYRGDQTLVDAVKNEFNERSADFMDTVMVRLKKVDTEKLKAEDESKLREFLLSVKNVDGALLVSKRAKKRTVNMLLYSVLDGNHPDIIADILRLESFVLRECPDILLGGIVNQNIFMEIGGKFKHRLKTETNIKQINRLIGNKAQKKFVNDEEGRIEENEMRLWQGAPVQSVYCNIAKIVTYSSLFLCAGSILGYLTDSVYMGFWALPVIFVVLFVIFQQVKVQWIIVTEKKLVYKERLYFWFIYDEVLDVKIVRRPIDYLLGTKTVVIKNVHTWADIHTRAVTRQLIGNSYISHVHDAEGLVAAIKQAMLKKAVLRKN